ncbi:MAG: PilZ domain-containing protein [Candidatus Omnitrophota bacterium]|jgi:c-di-GMP-binding flagellar brake protein YcgR|nr:PilZ domain-containing protein [Candidatus Omnitrophota bacterium]
MGESVESSDRRNNQRINFREPVQYQGKDLCFFGGTLSYDLSEGGIRLSLPDFIPLDTEIFLKIPLDREKVVDRTGRVVWVQKVLSMDRYQAGIRFERLDVPEYAF